MTTTEILDRRESSGTVTIASYEVTLDADGEKWNREDRQLLRKFLLSCFRAGRMVDKATAEVGEGGPKGKMTAKTGRRHPTAAGGRNREGRGTPATSSSRKNAATRDEQIEESKSLRVAISRGVKSLATRRGVESRQNEEEQR